MSKFVPPFPPRPARKLSAFQVIRRARRNFLEIFDEGSFRRRLTVTRLVNKPDFAPIMAEIAAEARDRCAPMPDGTALDMLVGMAEPTAEIITRTIFGCALEPGHVVEPICRLTLRLGDRPPTRLRRRAAEHGQAAPAPLAAASPPIAAEAAR